MPRDDLYLYELVEAADHVATWLSGATMDVWIDDELLRSAVLQKFSVIGEAARALASDVKERHPGVPWSFVVGFRNVVVHEYFALEWPAVWHIARHDLPPLRAQVIDVLRAEFPDIAKRYDGGRA